MVLVKISLSIQLGLIFLVLLLQIAYALRKKPLNNKRKGTAFFIYIDFARHDNAITFFYGTHHRSGAIAKKDGSDRSFIVMNVHVPMSGRCPFQADNIAFHSHIFQTKIMFQVFFYSTYNGRHTVIVHHIPAL